MSHAYRIMKSGLVLVVWAGNVAREALFEGERRLLTDPKLPSAPQVFVDITRASFETSIGEKEFQHLADLYQLHRDKTAGARVAILAGKDFERASLHGRVAEREKVNVMVFNTFNTACLWLGVKESEVREGLERIYSELPGISPPNG